MDSNKKFFSTYNMAVIAMGAVIITICSWLSFNFGEVPFTLQTFAIFAILMLLGGKRGTVAIIVYLLMGLVGLPVFAGFKGGAQSLVGPTGGFLVGFIAVGILYWLLADVLLTKLKEAFPDKRAVRMIMSFIICVICLALLYVFGTVWFVQIYTSDSGKASYATALSWCVTPFIIPDLVKTALAVIVADRTSFAIKK